MHQFLNDEDSRQAHYSGDGGQMKVLMYRTDVLRDISTTSSCPARKGFYGLIRSARHPYACLIYKINLKTCVWTCGKGTPTGEYFWSYHVFSHHDFVPCFSRHFCTWADFPFNLKLHVVPDYRILYFSLQPRDIKISAHCIFLHTFLNRGIQYIQLHLTNPFHPSLIK